MTLQEQYTELQKHRKQQSLDVINSKKRMAWEYFRNLVLVNNLEQNISKRFSLFYAPVRQIRGSNMTCWPFQDGSKEIYIDEAFALNNPQITNIQITHEVLHGLSQMKDGNQYFFGHQYQGNGQSIYTGIDEATTQLFAEDIEQCQLGKEEDYLYFVKNTMRVMKIIFCADKLANQYLNNNNQFEQEFDKLTNGKFSSFASLMNEVYTLSKVKHYSKLDDKGIELLETRKQQIINFVKGLVESVSKTNPQISENLLNEIQDKNFTNQIGVKQNNIEYAYFLHGTANQSPETLEDIFNNGLILEGDTSLSLHSTLAPISDEDIKKQGLESIMQSYSQLEDFNSVFLIKIPKEYLSCMPHRDGSVDIPMPLWKNTGNGSSVFCPHLIQGVYNKNINQGITNTNFCPIYNPNGMAYSWEQFNVFASYDRTDLMSEYKQRQLTSFVQQYASDNARGTFNQVVRYYQSKFGQLAQPQLFDSSEYRMLLEQTINQNNNFKK